MSWGRPLELGGRVGRSPVRDRFGPGDSAPGADARTPRVAELGNDCSYADTKHEDLRTRMTRNP